MTDLRQFTNYSGYYAATIIQGKPTSAAFYREFYQQLKAYSANNGLYDFINQELQNYSHHVGKTLRALRKPC
jgi:hypothetical protein